MNIIKMNEKVNYYYNLTVGLLEDNDTSLDVLTPNDQVHTIADQIYYAEEENLDWYTCIEVANRIVKKLNKNNK